MLDKAEKLARRVLERLGSKVDSKLAPSEQQTLTPREVGELTSRLERIIDANLREDHSGVKKIAPNRFTVLFTYEESARLSPQYIEAVADELKAIIYEYINNRRYETRGPVEVKTGSDLFGKITVIKVAFEGDEAAKPASIPSTAAAPKESDEVRINLRGADGRTFEIDLKQGGAPAYIGRAAGNSVRIDDPSLSRIHCSVALRSSGEVVIADLGSSNGTLLNGQLLGSKVAHPIKADDVITVGDVKLVVSAIS